METLRQVLEGTLPRKYKLGTVPEIELDSNEVLAVERSISVIKTVGHHLVGIGTGCFVVETVFLSRESGFLMSVFEADPETTAKFQRKQKRRNEHSEIVTEVLGRLQRALDHVRELVDRVYSEVTDGLDYTTDLSNYFRQNAVLDSKSDLTWLLNRSFTNCDSMIQFDWFEQCDGDDIGVGTPCVALYRDQSGLDLSDEQEVLLKRLVGMVETNGAEVSLTALHCMDCVQPGFLEVCLGVIADDFKDSIFFALVFAARGLGVSDSLVKHLVSLGGIARDHFVRLDERAWSNLMLRLGVIDRLKQDKNRKTDAWSALIEKNTIGFWAETLQRVVFDNIEFYRKELDCF